MATNNAGVLERIFSDAHSHLIKQLQNVYKFRVANDVELSTADRTMFRSVKIILSSVDEKRRVDVETLKEALRDQLGSYLDAKYCGKCEVELEGSVTLMPYTNMSPNNVTLILSMHCPQFTDSELASLGFNTSAVQNIIGAAPMEMIAKFPRVLRSWWCFKIFVLVALLACIMFALQTAQIIQLHRTVWSEFDSKNN